MHFLGFFLDNDSLRSAFHDIRECTEYVTMSRSSIHIASEYKSKEGQYRYGPTEEEKLAEITGIQAKIANIVTIDADRLMAGLEVGKLGDGDRTQKISTFDNTYIDSCFYFSDTYLAQGFMQDAQAMFIKFDVRTASMRLIAVPLADLAYMTRTSAVDKALREEASWVEQAKSKIFTMAMSANLPEQAKQALITHKLLHGQDRAIQRAKESNLGAPQDKPTRQAAKTAWIKAGAPLAASIIGQYAGNRIMFCFYSGRQKGCIIGSSFNPISGGRATMTRRLPNGLDFSRESHINLFSIRTIKALGLTPQEVGCFRRDIKERFPEFAGNLYERNNQARATARLAAVAVPA